MNPFIATITSEDNEIRNRSLDSLCADRPLDELLEYSQALDHFWRHAKNLYHRVRALFFLASIHRYWIPPLLPANQQGLIPFAGYRHLLERRFGEAIDALLADQDNNGPSNGLSSALARAYYDHGFQTLANQVRRSVRTVAGNRWMFRIGHPDDHPLRIQRELLERNQEHGTFPLLVEKTAVRMDFSHSGWSDVFFLGMDYPAGARVVNASVDLGVRGRDKCPRPPIETYLRIIDEPILRLVSVDLEASAEITTVAQIFDFAQDYLGLLKAAVIGAGIVPPGMEGCELGIDQVLSRVVGDGMGLEVVSKVNGIPKGSRLAVSTNLLGSLISICMRATGQVSTLLGALSEADRRIVAARAILGEWLGGSGGGWQDSGGIWPGIKLITGAVADKESPEFGVSRGRLLPDHYVFDTNDISSETRQKLQESLVLVHGGMAQNVGPILEMVTEKYLLRSPVEWTARQRAIDILNEITDGLLTGDIQAIGNATQRNFEGPLQSIIPWCTNLYTHLLIQRAQEIFGKHFWGFWMLGGMAGGGMGFIFDPVHRENGQDWLQQAMTEEKRRLQAALPFAMEPVVYDFAINDRGTWAELRGQDQAYMPNDYYALLVPLWLRHKTRQLSPLKRLELERMGRLSRNGSESPELFSKLLHRILPQSNEKGEQGHTLDALLEKNGFDIELHETIRADLQSSRIGLAQNRLSPATTVTNVIPSDVTVSTDSVTRRHHQIGTEILASGGVAVVSLAAGAGSRWTEGAGVVKALHPFCQLGGRHRSFLEVHLAKSRQTAQRHGHSLPHVFTTGYLTHAPISSFLQAHQNYCYDGPLFLSPGRAVGLRTVPMVRDLQFYWEEMPQQLLDKQQQKMRTSLRAALLNWARDMGEGSDYTDNVPLQCLHPVGHWYEVANLLRNGVLLNLIRQNENLSVLLMHNIDTVGASVDPGLLGLHVESKKCLNFEVIRRRLDDRGGGLARVDGQVRIVEGLAMPREEDEFALSYYNSMTTWIDIDLLLSAFGLDRETVSDGGYVDAAVRRLSLRIPTYVTIKDVKKRWGQGQEDIYPVTQFEKLWSDMTSLAEIGCGFFDVPLVRGQQLKEQSQLDGWLRDGSAAYLESLCQWT